MDLSLILIISLRAFEFICAVLGIPINMLKLTPVFVLGGVVPQADILQIPSDLSVLRPYITIPPSATLNIFTVSLTTDFFVANKNRGF